MINSKNLKTFFTIIIPTLNEEQHLPLLLKDLTRQTFTDFQVIIIDGKSEDQTKAKALEFKNRLNLTFKQTSVRNVSHQRNLGAQQSKSPYLVFFDADIRIPQNFLQRIHHFLSQYPTDILSTWVKSPSQKPKDQLISSIINTTFEIAKYFSPGANGSHLIISTSKFNQSPGFNPQIKFGEDSVLIKQIINQGGKFVLLKQPQVYYSLRRFNREGYTNTLFRLALLNLHQVFGDPTKPPPFTYPMGGKSKKSQLQIQYLNKITQQINLLTQNTKTQLKAHPELGPLLTKLKQQWHKFNTNNLPLE